MNTGSVCSDQCHGELELLGCAGNHEHGAGILITCVFISTFMYMYLLVVLVLVSRRYECLVLHSTSAVLCDCRLVGCSEESRSTCPPIYLELLPHSLVLAKVWIRMTFYIVLLCLLLYLYFHRCWSCQKPLYHKKTMWVLKKLRSVAAMCSGLLRLLLGMCSKISVFVYCTCLWIELESIQSLN